ncbi:MAG TPA: NAD(P)H-dependent oxidoreductase [Candidatus Saccharimonadales bacterium]|nr:NAD(P)H-dependent oxidoreductase [Candidatus Saccharimonadales bacterium]
MTKPKILVITSTIREGRSGRKIAEWYIDQAKKVNSKLNFELLDIDELDLPLFNEPLPPVYRQYSELQNKLADIIAEADGFVFITGEYNYSVPGSLKNFLDYVYAEWGRRPATFVAYGVHGGVRAIQDLVHILSGLGVPTLSWYGYTLHIDSPWEAFDDNDKLRKELLKGDVTKQVNEFQLWVEAFKDIRLEASGEK